MSYLYEVTSRNIDQCLKFAIVIELINDNCYLSQTETFSSSLKFELTSSEIVS